jgi:hypothetical protein
MSGSSMKIHLSEVNFRKSSTFLSKARPPWDYSSVVTDMLKFYAEQVCVFTGKLCTILMAIELMFALGGDYLLLLRK